MPSPITDQDLYLFNEGTHFRLYDVLGAHAGTDGDREGTWFAVWAPNAAAVSVIGEFNRWDKRATPMAERQTSGIWEVFVPDVTPGATLQVPRHLPLPRLPGRQGRPLRLLRRDAAGARLGGLGSRIRLVGRRLDAGPRRQAVAHRADVDLRGPPRLLAAGTGGREPFSHLSRNGAGPRRAHEEDGLHPRRDAPRDGAPVLRLLGLSVARLLRADQPLSARRRI